MTPDEAVAELIPRGVMPLHVWSSAKRYAKAQIDACVATAKAEAKADETRRCADYVRSDRGLNWLADDILRTGGLKVETDTKLKIVDKRPRSPEPLLVRDCTLGTVVMLTGASDNCYLIARIGSQGVCGVNLEGGGYVDGGAHVKHMLNAELHVVGVI